MQMLLQPQPQKQKMQRQPLKLMEKLMELYMSGVGKVKFQFTGSTDVKAICKAISKYTLA